MSIIYTKHFSGAKKYWFSFPRNVSFKKALFVPNGTLTADGSNYMELKIYANDKTEVLAVFSNHSGSGQTYTDATLYEGTNLNMDESDFSSSQIMKVESTLAGSGTLDGMLVLEFEPARLV
tara:strand:- start:4761 stop:5123 length:363 start_codon:yes stop_codon:yes gene_type:complete